MESTHCKLCTWFTDRLSSNNTNRFTYTNASAACHICSVTFSTDTNFATASKNCSDKYFFNTCFFNSLCHIRSNFAVGRNNNFACFRMSDFINRPSASDSVLKRLDNFISVKESLNPKTRSFLAFRCTIPFINNNFLRYINKTSCKVT